MIKSKADMISLCGKSLQNLTEHDKRLLLFNYAYHVKGEAINELMTLPIGNELRFAAMVHKAYRYFENL